MRTISPPLRPSKDDWEYHITCRNCLAVMACKKKDLYVSPDPRDTGVYKMTCPHCGKDTWINNLKNLRNI